jgi:hypothetical protein
MLWKLSSTLRTMQEDLKRNIKDGTVFDFTRPPEWLLEVYRKNPEVLGGFEKERCRIWFEKYPHLR